MEAISQEITVLIAAHQCTLSSESPIYSTELQPISFTFTATRSSHLLTRLQRSFRRKCLRLKNYSYMHRSFLLGVITSSASFVFPDLTFLFLCGKYQQEVSSCVIFSIFLLLALSYAQTLFPSSVRLNP